MPLRPEYTLHQSELTAFLAAPLWEERNGSLLSVLSALARLDIDPWAEAARLAALPRDAAASALAVILHRLPAQHPGVPDAATTADRLVRLLPEGGGSAAADVRTVDRNRRKGGINAWLYLLVIAALVAWVMNGSWS